MAIKTLGTRLTALLLCVLLLASLSGCSLVDQYYLDRIAELEQQNADLTAQVAVLTSQLEAMKSSILQSWELTAEASGPIGSPASIRFSAIPAIFQPGQHAVLSVMLDGREKASVPCVWDGKYYNAVMSLEPADGYAYYCILTGSNGKEERTALTTPDQPEIPELTYLESSMTPYCNLIVEDWQANDQTLTILSGTGIIQLPLLRQTGQSVSVKTAALIFQKNGEELENKEVLLNKGSSSTNFTVDLNGLSFALPETRDDDQLDLWLEVVLSTNEKITSPASSWYQSSGSLELVVG